MSERNDGGPAFPLQAEYYEGTLHPAKPGMTLRDWFAGQALQGLLANSDLWQGMGGGEQRAYEIADAMLEEREK